MGEEADASKRGTQREGAEREGPEREGPERTSTERKSTERKSTERKAVLVRLDPAVHTALQRWAADELRSVNAQIEVVLRDALRAAGRAPRDAGPIPRRGRPPRSTD